MDRNRILEKIQKALNLANNHAATPGEAAAALRSAQRMMEHYGVEEAELGLFEYGFETVPTTTQATAGSKVIPPHIGAVADLLCSAFGIKCFYRKRIAKTDLAWSVEYYGRKDKVTVAAYTHQVLMRAVERSWSEHLRSHPELKKVKGARYSFFIGFCTAVRKQVEAIALSEEEKLALDKLLESAELTINTAKEVSRELNMEAAMRGLRAAKDFRLHRPVGG